MSFRDKMDAERYRELVRKMEWFRTEEDSFLAVRLPYRVDLCCQALRDDAIGRMLDLASMPSDEQLEVKNVEAAMRKHIAELEVENARLRAKLLTALEKAKDMLKILVRDLDTSPKQLNMLFVDMLKSVLEQSEQIDSVPSFRKVEAALVEDTDG